MAKKGKGAPKSRGKVIGIDLGTTNSEVAVMEGGKPVVIPSAEGSRYFPSVVAFTKDGERLVGEAAKRQAITNPERTIMEIKRKMGTDYKMTIDDKDYTPQEISAMILSKLRADAEAYLGEKITEAVISVPAYFNDNQRTATRDAGLIAGLEVKRIVNEPTAAAMAYGLDKDVEDQTIVVLDLGGGTFDVTIMGFGEGTFEVEATSGDTQLGGSDMDRSISKWILEQFEKEHDMEISDNKEAMQRIRDAAEKAKMELTSTLQTTINLPFLHHDSKGPKHLELTLSRAKMEELIEPILKRLEPCIRTALKDAKMTKDDIHRVILVGGPTRMPCVRDRFKKFFDKEPERGVDPMECVAIGAAIQAGVLTGEVKDIVLVDVTPLSLGVETKGGIFTVQIERNTAIPSKKKQIYSTAADHQTTVTIHVLQGERKMAEDNVSLGMFNLTGLPPAPMGIPQIEVEFNIDRNGILNVKAKDLGTGKETGITITASTKLPQADIERMMDDAKKHADKDKGTREKVEAMNNAEHLVYASKQLVKDMGDKLTKDQKESLQKGAETLQAALDGDDMEAIKKESEAFTKTMNTISTAIYQQASQAYAQAQGDKRSRDGAKTGPSPEPEEGGEDEEQPRRKGRKGEKVVDADYKVVDEDKKDDEEEEDK
jgi:molecular chaperone DnaK